MPARNSSSIGRSSGSLVGEADGRDGGITAVVPACAHHLVEQLVDPLGERGDLLLLQGDADDPRHPSRAWRKNVRAPGSPTVPATKRSGGSKPWTIGGMIPAYDGA